MRQVLLAVLLLSCAGDESRRASERRSPEAAPDRSADHRSPEAAPTRAAAPAVVAEREPPADPRAATRRAAHDALAEHCGECHEGHRSSTPKALAVFDLDLPDWPGRFDAHRFASAAARLAKKSEPARMAFLAFRDAELAAAPK
jgi:hypothetical protein